MTDVHSTTYDRRPVGLRGEKRRESFLQALEDVVEYTPWRRVSVAILATQAECSPATFYQYWTSVEDAALEIVQRKRAAMKKGQPLGPRWTAISALLATETW